MCFQNDREHARQAVKHSIEESMLARTKFSSSRTLLMVLAGIALTACESSIPPENGMVDWYLSNGTERTITLRVYDEICKRNYPRVRVSRTTQTPMSTCANSAGRAEVRYQRAGLYNNSDNPWRNAVVQSGRSQIVRLLVQ